MKQSTVLFSLFGAVGLAGLLSACGSEGSPSASGNATVSGSASASGTITDFGSIYINGKKFESNDVEVIQNGQSSRCSINLSTTCGLKKGMTVTVNGSFNESLRTARSVLQRDAVEGLVQSVAADRLVVMGQTVLFDDTTIFDNNFTPVAGTFVEVHGHVRPNGMIQATFIEPKNQAEVTPEVQGYVGNHNDGDKTFRIENLTVNYGGPNVDISDRPAPSGSNWNDRFVEVKGTVAGFNNATEPTVFVRLVLLQPGARSVSVAVDFNGWDPAQTKLERSDGGVWTATIPLKPGRYQYMFVIDGKQWIADPLAAEEVTDGFGAQNAVLDVAI